MAPMDRENKLQKSRVIYKFKCAHLNSPEEYTGESGRAFGDRLKGHCRAPSPIHQHSSSTVHPVSPDCFTIVHREAQETSRNIKEGMCIQVNDSSLNRNLGKYQLPHLGPCSARHSSTLTIVGSKNIFLVSIPCGVPHLPYLTIYLPTYPLYP